MNRIDLDASTWKSVADMYVGLHRALKSPPGYGHSVDAMLEAMIWDHANDPDFPPYVIRVRNVAQSPKAVRDGLLLIQSFLPEVLQEFRETRGRDFQMGLEIS